MYIERKNVTHINYNGKSSSLSLFVLVTSQSHINFKGLFH
ncbi:unknown; predicted coding region [Mycoplasmopsis pulmonis]|uniref:Uncharacterized protein n=1 Tax=Mycoplasmopsis pulmonis (strain UAB CTIP) TaxID=272635 RepID=Q98RB8_MYCPU|nr:unknown; predicted coding region [Mycoplasmopsis pulmonis]